eukprot:gene727-14_t
MKVVSKKSETFKAVQKERGRVEDANNVKKHDGSFFQTPINVPMCIYIGLCHLLGLIGLCAMVAPASWTAVTGVQAPTTFSIASAWVLWPITGLGITAGAHRLWAHRSYQGNFFYRCVVMVFNSMANQGTIFHWSRDHRVHHLYSDTEKDPYNASRGFFFSHVGWLLLHKCKETVQAGRDMDLSDLLADPVVRFQKRVDPFWNLFWCFGVPTIAAHMMGDSWINGLLIPGAFRYVLILHGTWLVNSYVHAIGDSKPYNPSHATTESGFVSIIALGEGWHNWHHAYPWDYAASELDWYQQYNPTKMVIDIAAFFGLVTGRKRGLNHWKNRQRRWIELHGNDPVLGLKGFAPFYHRDIDYGMFECDAASTPTKASESENFSHGPS